MYTLKLTEEERTIAIEALQKFHDKKARNWKSDVADMREGTIAKDLADRMHIMMPEGVS